MVARLRNAYPGGLLNDLDETALVSEERDNRIKNVIQAVTVSCDLNVYIMPFDSPSYGIIFSKKNDPPYVTWIWIMNNSDKISWINSNKGEPYSFLFLKINRIADYYYYFYNYCLPRGDTGYLDFELHREPVENWNSSEMEIRSELKRNKFTHFTEEMSREKVDFLLEYNYALIPHDDPRWDDIDFEPPLEPASLHACLFSN